MPVKTRAFGCTKSLSKVPSLCLVSQILRPYSARDAKQDDDPDNLPSIGIQDVHLWAQTVWC